jgi:hypothetical protein
MTVSVPSQNQKRLLKFLADHNYDFTFADLTEPKAETLAGKLKKRELKSNMKIAAAIEQMKRSYRQMEFFEKMAESPKDAI